MAWISDRARRFLSRVAWALAVLLVCAVGSAHAAADLTIAKSHAGDFRSGTNGTYRLVVTNVGDAATLSTTTVTDTLPAGLSFVSGLGPGWGVSESGQVVTCTLTDPIAAGDTSGVTLNVLPDPSAVPSVTNSAVVSSPDDTNAANDRALDPTTVLEVDLGLSKTHAGDFAVGTNGAYTIFVANVGSAATLGTTTVRDTLPAGLTFVSGSGSGWSVNASGQVVTATHSGTIAGGGITSFTLTVSVGSAAFPGVTNAASVTTSGDGNAANNRDTDATVVTASPDLSIAKSHSGDFAAGSNGTWTISVSNDGSLATSGVITVLDTLPSAVAFVSGSGSGWSVNASGQVVTATRAAALAPGNSAAFTITAAISPAAFPSTTNRAHVSTPGDANDANDHDSDAVTVTGAPNAAVTKSSVGSFQAGSNGTYTLEVTNTGNLPTTGATTVVDTLRAGLTFVSGSGSGWSVNASGQIVTATRAASIAPGNSASVSLTVAVGLAAAPNVVNGAKVSTAGDVTPADDYAAITTPVATVVDLSISKSHSGAFVVGSNASWDLTVANVGSAPTSGITTVLDTLPSGITFVSGSGSGWSFSVSGQVVSAFRSTPIAVGANSSFSLTVAVGAGSLPGVTNAAVVQAVSDTDPANDRDTDPTPVSPQPAPNLALGKSHTGSFTAGTNGTWTIAVSNSGAAATSGITTVRDTLPLGVTFVSGSGSGWSFSTNGQIVTAIFPGSIAAAANTSFDLTVAVGAGAVPGVTNFASVTTPGDTDPANDRDSDATVVSAAAAPNLGLTKSHAGSFTAGTNGTWNIGITNSGSAPTSGITTVLDTLPAGIAYLSGSGSGWSFSTNGQIVTAIHAASIAAAGSAPLSLTVAVGAGAVPGVTNSASVSTAGDTDPANDRDSDATVVSAAAVPNLSLTKSHSGSFTAGSNGTWTLSVNNPGAAATSGLTTVRDTLPAGLTFVSGSGSGWSFSTNGQIVTAIFPGSIAAGANTSFTLTVAVGAGAVPSVTNSASVSTAGDIDPANDRASDPTIVNPAAVPNLSLTKSHSGSFTAGTNGTWNLNVTNSGTASTTGITTVLDTLPAGLTYVSGSGSGWSFSANGQIVSAVHPGAIAAGAGSPFTLTAAVGVAAVPGVTNFASVSTAGDSDASNDRASDPTVVNAPNLSIAKSHSGSFTVGTSETWTITVTNSGASPTSGITTVLDTLPLGVTYGSATGAGWSFSTNGQIVTAVRAGSIASGGNAAFNLTVAVGAGAMPSVTNSASVSTPGDSDPGNDRASDPTVVNPALVPDLSVTKSHTGSFAAGTNGTWTIAVTNSGSAPTSGITTVLDTLPAGLTYVSATGTGWSFSTNGQVVTALHPAAIAIGASRSLDLTVAVGAAAVPGVTNAAAVSTPGDIQPANDRATDPTVVNPAAVPNLTVAKSHVGSFAAGTNGTWNLTVTNSGSAPTFATTTVLDTLPAGVTYVSGSGSGWGFSVAGPVVTAIRPTSIAVGTSSSFDITAAFGVAAVPGVTNSASVSTAGDGDASNDRASDPTVVNPAAVPNLSITKTHPGNFTAGTSGTWTITVANTGSAPTFATTTVLDTLPAGITYVSGTGSGWSFSVNGPVVSAIRVGPIAVGANSSFDLTVAVGGAAVPAVTNAASVSTPGDNQPGNDRATDPTVVNPALTPNLSLTKSHTGSFTVGTNGTWTIAVSNSGAVPTSGVTTVSDTLPAGISYVSGAGSGWSFSTSGQIVSAVRTASIAAGANSAFDLTVAVGAAAQPGVTNFASVSTSGDIDPSGDRGSDPTSVNAPNLSIAKSHVGSFTVGANGTWTIAVTNTGTASTSGVTTVLDTLPAGISYVSGAGAGWSFSVSGQVVTALRAASIATSASSSFDLTVGVGAAAQPGVTNSASVSTPGDTQPGNDRAMDPTVVNAAPTPNLSITKSHAGSFTVGTNGTWTIAVTNSGAVPTSGITTVSDTLPVGISYVTGAGSGWSFSTSGSVVTAVRASSIAAGANSSFSLTVAVGIAAYPSVTNFASVSTPGDNDPSGDRASDPTVVNAPNLSIAKSHVGNFTVGTNGTWNIGVTNSGTAPTSGVTTVLDTLPAGISYVSGTGSGWSFSVSGQIVTANRAASVATGTSSSFDLTVAVGAAAAPGVTNSASGSTPGDTQPGDDRATDPTIVNAAPTPNLSITKSHTGSFTVGTNGTWTIALTNSGTVPTTGITTVSDTLPAGLTYVSGTGSGWSFSTSGSVVTAVRASSIAAGANSSFSLTVAVGIAAYPSVTNFASVSTPGDNDPSGDRASDPTVVNAPNLSIAKSHVGNFTVGTNGTWNIGVTNSGTAPTSGVTTVLDTLPAGISYVSGAGAGWSFSVSGQIVTANRAASIATGTSSSFDFTVAVGAAAAPGVTNSASVSTPGDTQPGDDRATDPTIVNAAPTPNLSITKSHVGSFTVGTNGTWTIAVTNIGTAATSGVTTVLDTLPAGISFISGAGSGWSFSTSGQNVTAIRAGSIAAGASSTFDLTVVVGAAAHPGVTNFASGSTPTDNDPTNDRASDPTVVNAPNLSITKSHVGNFTVGTNGTWTIGVTNSGTAPTSGVTTVLDTLPAGISYVSGTGSGWSFSVSGQVVTANRAASIATSASSSFDLTVAVAALAVPGVTNFASVNTAGDTDLSGNRASDATIVNAAPTPNLSIAKSHAGSFTVGTNGTWTIALTNIGAVPTTGITTVSDTLPAGLTYVSGTGSGWSFSTSGSVVTAVRASSIAAGANSSFNLTVAVGLAAHPGVTNFASVSTPGDNDPTGDRASDPTVVNAPNLSITKSHVGNFTVGTNGTWTIAVTNSGTAPTSGVTTVLDTLPAGISYVSGTGSGWSFSVSGQIVTANRAASVATGTSSSFDLTVAVGAAAAPGVTNSASGSTPGDTQPGDDRATDPTIVNAAPTPNLSITKSHTGSFTVGTNGTWTIALTNSGTVPTTGITTVSDTLPAGLTYVSGTGSGWSFSTSGPVVTAVRASPIAAGASSAFDITVAVGAAAHPGVTNFASVSTPGDNDPTGDRASDPTIVNAPNLSITKSHVGNFTVGTNGTWTIGVTNSGTAPTSGVTTVLDTLPAGISYVSGAGAGWSFSVSGQVVTASRATSIATAASASFDLAVAVGVAAVPGVTNAASASTAGDTDLSDNRATDPTIVNAAPTPNLSITKSHAGSFTVGTSGTWTIAVTNSGTVPTSGITTVSDTLPAGITYVSGTGSGWSFSTSGQVVTAVRASSIAAGANSAFDVTVAVGAAAHPGVTNFASVTTPGDNDPSGDRASDPTVVNAPNLSIAKSHVGNFTVGTNGTWSIAVTNSGTAPTTAVTTVLDTLPAGITYVSGTGASWSFSVSGQIVTANRAASIATSASSSFDLTVAVGAPAVPGVTNSASVSTTGDTDLSGNRDSDPTIVNAAPTPNLSITKAHTGSFTVGTNATWTIAVTNIGTAATSGTTTVLDTLPAGISYVSGTGTGWSFSVSGQVVTAIRLGTIPPASGSSFDVTVAVGAAAQPGVTNFASVSTPADNDPTNDRASDATVVNPALTPNLSITKSHAGNFTVGTNGTWTLAVTNSGSAPTSGTTTVLDTLPAGVTYVSGAGTGWSFSVNGPIVTALRLGTILPGASSTLDLTVAVGAAAHPLVTNSASVSTLADLDPSGDRASDPTLVNAPNLSIAKSHAVNFTVGTQGTWTIAVTNSGTAPTSGVTTVSDTLPAGITYVSGTGAGWSFSVTGQVVTAVRPGAIAEGASSSFDLTVAVGAAAQPGVTNSASVSTPGDTDLSANRASDATVVNAPNLSITKSHAGNFTAGTSGTWTIAVTNSGSAPTSGTTTVSDTLPSGLTYVSAAGAGWSFSVNGQIVTALRLGPILAGSSSAFDLTVAVGAAAQPGVTNFASVSTPGDTDPSGDRTQDPTVVNAAPTPNLSITKSHAGNFTAGATGTWTIAVTNSGTAPTTGVTTVSDTLPAGISYVSGTGAGWSFSVSGPVVTAVRPTSIAAGASSAFDLTVAVGAAAQPGVTNFASVTTPGDTDPSGDRAQDATVVNPAAAPNVSITKSHVGSFAVGTNGTWTITVTNSGSAPTSGTTTVSDTLPPGISHVFTTGAGWSFSVSGPVVTALHLAGIAPGASRSFDLTVAVGAAAQPGVTNSASVSTAGDTDPSGDRASDATVVNPAAVPNLSITKSHVGSFTAGTNGTWTLAVTNSGSAPTSGITTVLDTLPTGVTYVSGVGAGWSFSVSGQVVTAVRPGSIAVGGSSSFDLAVAVGAAAVPGVTNAASVSTPGDINPVGDRETDPTVVNPAPAPNLSITKSHAGSFTAGTNGTWTLAVTNSGSAPTSGTTTVLDTLPGGTTFASAAGPGWSFSVSGQVVTAIRVTPIAAGTSSSFDMTVAVGAPAVPGVTNFASVSTPGDTDTSGDRASDPTVVSPAAAPDLSIIKAHLGDFTAGTNGTWTIAVTNSGTAPTTGTTTVLDTLPAGITYVSASGAGWGFSVNGPVVTAIRPSSIAVGASASFDITVAVGAPAVPAVTNSASVSTPGDTDPSGDRASDVTVVHPAAAPNLSITKSHVGNFTAGTNGKWTLTVTNSGSAPTSVTTTVVDTLPAGITYVSATGAGWGFSVSGQVVTAIRPSPIGAASSTFIELTVAVGAAAQPGVTNSASVSTLGDPDPSGDRASDPTVVNPAPTPNLSLTKSHIGSFAAGANGTWTLTVTNSGAAPTSGTTTVRDTLPTGITYVASNGTGWSFSVSGQVVTAVHPAAIAAGASTSFGLTAAVAAPAVPGVTNSATVETLGDTDPSGDRASDPTAVNPAPVPNLSIAKSHLGSFTVGTNGTWTIAVTNSGSAATSGITTVVDTLPAGITRLLATGAGWSFTLNGQVLTAFHPGTIAPGVARAFDLIVAVAAPAVPGVTNSASVSTPGDTDPLNDRASDPTIVNPAPAPNLSIAKSHAGRFTANTTGTWTITVANAGSAPTSGITTVTDTLPAGVSFVSGTGASWGFSVSGQVVTAIHPGTIAVGASSAFDLTAMIGAVAVPGVTNYASVSTPGDTDAANDRASDPTAVNPAPVPNLGLTKSHTGTFTVGLNGTWTMAVTNSGSAPTSGITTVVDTLPLGVTRLLATGTGWSFTLSGQVFTAIHPGAIAPGATRSFDLIVAVAAAAVPGVTNSASVITPGDTDATNDRASDPTIVNAAPAPNLAVTKSHAGSFTAGTNGTWTITVTNTGPAATSGVSTVTDTLPAGVTHVAASGVGWSFTEAGQVVTAIHPGSIAPGASRSFDLTAAIGVAAVPGMTNMATVSTPGDNDATNDRASDPTVVLGAATPDLSLAKSHAGSFAVGANGTWTIVLTNSGTAPTSGVTTVRDTLPVGTSYVSGAGPGWSFSVSGRVVTAIHPAPIAAGATSAFDLTAAISAAALPSITNFASVDSPGDSDARNDRGGDATVVNPAPAPNLGVTKTHVSTFVVGANGSWIIAVTNSGSAPTSGVTTVRDTLPAGITYIAATGSGWSFSVSGQVVTAIHPAAIAPGAGASFDMTAAIGAAAAPGVTNSATVDTPGDNDAADDRAQDPTVVNQPPAHDVGLAMSDLATVMAGDTTTYTLTVMNTRAVGTTGTIVVRDTLPAGLTFLSASGTGWTFTTNGQVVSAFWSTSLAGGATAAWDMSVRVRLSAMPSVTNAATVSLAGDDDPTNDRALDEVAVLAPPAPDLTIAKSHASDFIVGRNGTYTLTVSNIGGSDAVGPMVVRDTLPTGLTYAAATGSGWAFSQSGNVAQAVNLGSLAPGTSSSFEITVSVGIAAAPGVSNSATVSVAGDADASNNRAVDPAIVHVPGMLTLEKRVAPELVEPGDFVTYTLTIRNPSPTDADSVEVHDRFPVGVNYEPSTAFVNGTLIANPVAHEKALVFSLGTIPSNGSVVLRYRARVGVGAPLGDGINRARAKSPTDNVESNLASAMIEVRDGAFDPRGIIFGKVYVDWDCDPKDRGTQGHRELGIPGVRLLLEDGSVAITDVEGKYHFEGVSPRAHVLRVDQTTLPPGSRLAAPGSRDMLDNGTRLVDLQRGEMHRADFLESSHEEDVLDAVVARRALRGVVKGALAERIVMDADTLRRVRPEPAPAIGASGLLAHGIVTGRLDLRSRRGVLAHRDAFEDELRDAALGTSDGRAHASARGAMYMQGVLTGGYELTVATDSERDPRQRLFRDIEPDAFYPVYGDASLLEYGAPSTGLLFARIRKDSSFVQYGDFTTPAEPTRRLGRYDRSFTGVSQRFAGKPLTLDAWGAESRTRRVVDELPGRGTSGPYALGRTDARENSELVDILVRDRNQPSRVLASRRLARFADYQIDFLTGEIVLRAPLASLDHDLNPQALRVTYEVEGAGEPYLVYGAGLRARAGSVAEVSGHAVHDEDPFEPRDLLSAGAALFAGPNTALRVEMARSDSAGVRGGDAKRAELVHRSKHLYAEVVASRVAPDFVNPSSSLGTGRSELAARVSAMFDSATMLRAEGLSTQDDVTDGRREGYDLSLERRFGRASLLAGYRNARESATPADSATAGTTPHEFTSARGRLTLPFVLRGTLFAEYEQDLQSSESRRALVGSDWQARNGARLYARHELLSSYAGPYALHAGRELQTTLVGIDAPVSASGRSFGEYRARDAFAGRDAQAAFGLRNRWTARPGLHLDGSFERILPLQGGGPEEATAVTGGLEYTRSPRWKGTARAEWRTSDQGDDRLMSAGLARKLSRDWTFLSRALWHDRESSGRSELRLRTGLAWRQTLSDRWHALARYDAHRLEEGEGSARIDRVTHVVGGDLNFRPGTRWTTSLHATGRHADDRSGGVRTESRTTWLASRLLWDLTPRWDVGLSASSLFDRGMTGHRYGLGFEAGRTLGTNVRLASGYNLFGYRDDEMTGGLTTDHGAYLTLRFKFDEALFRARRTSAPAPAEVKP